MLDILRERSPLELAIIAAATALVPLGSVAAGDVEPGS